MPKLPAVNFTTLIHEKELAAFLSPEYCSFAAAVKEGLAVFLSGLPEEIQRKIIQDQIKLGQQATLPQRLRSLAQNSPVLHKFGQMLARNQHLAPALRVELQKLEWLQPSLSRQEIEAELHREIGSLKDNNISLAPEPLAEASVAIVIPFATIEASQSSATPVYDKVFKLLKPGIEDRLQLEFILLNKVGRVLDEKCQQLDIVNLEYEKIFAQVSESLQKEILLEKEQQNLLEAAALYTRQPRIKIPKVLQPCTSRVTAMERIKGHKLEASTIDSAHVSRQMADLVVKALVVQPIFSAAERALFHGDPHAGNLFHTTDGQLALLDWSQADHLERSQRKIISQIMLAAISSQPEKIARLISRLALRPIPDTTALQGSITKSLDLLRSGHLPGFSWLVKLLDATVLDARVSFPSNVLFFRKSVLTVAGIVEELSGVQERGDIVVLQEFMHIFAEEWQWRWQIMPYSSDRTSHLSNADLLDAATAAIISSPAALAEYWLSFFERHNTP